MREKSSARNSGAPWHNDFVELFNPTNSWVSMSGWSVQYASATGVFTTANGQLTIVNGTIPPGGYFLVQEAAGTGGGAALPTPDAVGVSNLSSTSGKVVLANVSTPLNCGSDHATNSCVGNPNLVDYIGYGSSVTDYEGSGPAPAPSNTSSVTRNGNGCNDDDNNGGDFSATTTITPRNSLSPYYNCQGTPTITYTPTVTPTITPTAPPCGPNSNYTVSQATGTIVLGGTLVSGSQCDDCTSVVTLPFSYNLYGTVYTTARLSDNGSFSFVANSTSFLNTCLPNTAFNDTIFAYWDDLDMRSTVSPYCETRKPSA